jgi:hypothetical protein
MIWGSAALLLKQKQRQHRQIQAIIPKTNKIKAIEIPAVGPGAISQQSTELFAKHKL